jgi:hydrogenase maturation protease
MDQTRTIPSRSRQSVAPSISPPVTIAGAGNWLIACDRVGPRALELLEGRYGAEVELYDCGSSGLALLDCLRGQELLVVVDACRLGGESGEIRVIEADVLPESAHAQSVHQIGPLETLGVAAHLFPENLPSRAMLVTVETDGLDDAGTESACRRVLRVLDGIVDAWKIEANNQEECRWSCPRS